MLFCSSLEDNIFMTDTGLKRGDFCRNLGKQENGQEGSWNKHVLFSLAADGLFVQFCSAKQGGIAACHSYGSLSRQKQKHFSSTINCGTPGCADWLREERDQTGLLAALKSPQNNEKFTADVTVLKTESILNATTRHKIIKKCFQWTACISRENKTLIHKRHK